MSKYVIFYYLDADYDYVYIDAESLKHASDIADAFSRTFDAIIVGICPEFLLKTWHYE